MKKGITVYLVRHGQTCGNAKKIIQGQNNAPLNDIGKRQSEEVAEFFKKIPLTHIYCSPVRRAKQTVLNVMKYHSNLRLVELLDLSERNSGSLEGYSEKKLLKEIPDVKEQWAKSGVDWRAPGKGETIRELYSRTNAQFKKIIAQHKPGDIILIMTHGGNIKCILAKLNNQPADDYPKITNPVNCEVIRITCTDSKRTVKCVLIPSIMTK